MREIGMVLAIAAVMSGSMTTAQTAYAAQSSRDTNVYTQPAVAIGPKVQTFDCRATTGDMGCGPGWFWRDGWRGWACYPC
jgi:curli biogenesis system outer membrane secretion channel CsgG